MPSHGTLPPSGLIDEIDIRHMSSSLNSPARPAQSPPTSRRTSRVESIQWLRGVAAMLVVCNHAILLLHKYTGVPDDAAHQFERNLALAGAFGVDIFFVISGFVMALSAQRFVGGRGAATFLAQRYNRIAPLFYLLSAILLLDMIRAGVPFGAREIVNTVTFVPWFDGREYHWPIHFLGWTLAYEFVFYLVVAVFIWCRRSASLVLLIAVLVGGALVGAVIECPWMPVRMLTSPMMVEFAFGVLLFIAWRAGRFERATRWWWALPALALLAWAWPVLSADPIVETVAAGAFSHDTAAQRLFWWGLPALAIAAWTLTLGAGRNGIARRLAQAFGDASYSIYLTHLFVLRIGEEVIKRFDAPAWLVALVGFLLSALVGWLCYRLVEQPLLRAGQLLLARFGTRARAAAARSPSRPDA